MLIIFAESMTLFANSLKSINGDGAFFSTTTNRNNETSDANEKMTISIKLFDLLSPKIEV